MNKIIALLTIGIICLLGCATAYAATQSVTANIKFDSPITLTKNLDISFGTVSGGVAPTTYTISTNGTVTTASGPGEVIGGTSHAGKITLNGSLTSLMKISVGSFVTGSQGTVLSNPTCSYDGGVAGSCTIIGASGPGAGKVLLIGVDASAPTVSIVTTDAPSFTVTALYQ
jgi:hypothetical protein